MARYSEHDTSKIYEAADAFCSNCLLRNGSLLFDVANLWRPYLLESIHKAFVATPDEGDRSFIDKFRDQIQPAGTEVIRLAAELLAVYFLFPFNVGGFRKRQVVNEVLGWAGDNLPETHLVSQAFEQWKGSAQANRGCVKITARDCSPLQPQPTAEEAQWLRRLAKAVRASDLVIPFSDERDDEPIM